MEKIIAALMLGAIFGGIGGSAVGIHQLKQMQDDLYKEWRAEVQELDNRWEQQIIDRNLGLYGPRTGKFAFNDECD